LERERIEAERERLRQKALEKKQKQMEEARRRKQELNKVPSRHQTQPNKTSNIKTPSNRTIERGAERRENYEDLRGYAD
jgi:hypothetical protein